MTDDFAEWYLVQTLNGKMHVIPRMGRDTAACGSVYYNALGYIKGKEYWLRKLSQQKGVCKTCRLILNKRLDYWDANKMRMGKWDKELGTYRI